MVKKITIRDVAREAGVSVATVSYVLNHRTDQKISPDTQKKVLQIANLLQYSPSYAAKLFTTGKSNIIGIQTNRYTLHNTEIYNLIEKLVLEFDKHGYSSLLLPPFSRNSFKPQENIDGIVCIDLPQEDFDFLSDKYLIPIVCCDMLVEHYLFFQVYNDYGALLKRLSCFSDYLVLMERPQNHKYADFLSSCFQGNLQFCSEPADFQRIQYKNFSKIIIVGDFLTLFAQQFIPADRIVPVSSSLNSNYLQSSFIPLDLSEKAEKTVNAMFDAMERKPISHDIRISL